MERYCSTGQSSQRAVAPTEEEEEVNHNVSWLGHLQRMEEDRMPKKIFTQELEGTRRRGRPRKGWREEV